jgi:hypothetical protein
VEGKTVGQVRVDSVGGRHKYILAPLVLPDEICLAF